MILNGGSYRGVRILSPMAVATMTRPHAVSETGAARGLGWDFASSFSVNKGDLFPLGSFGHTGFTGTSLWIDPASDTFVVFLSNRVHPDGKGDVASLRGRVASIAAGAITDATVAKARAQAADASMELLASLARWNTPRAAQPAIVPDAQVLTGIDVLERDGFKQLAGMRIGLITNHTGRNRAGRSTIDVLHKAPGVKLVALFSPEHGIRGLLDDKVRTRRRANWIADLFALRRVATTEARALEGSRRAGFRHSGHRRALLHLHFDTWLRHGRSRESEVARLRSRSRESD